MLNTEQWLLKNYLEKHFEYGKWFSIEEICNNVCYSNGEKIFKLNTDPKNHDKCIKLSNMVREINYATDEGQKLIIKNKQGGIKLAENKEEFDSWRDGELKKLEKKWKYLNNLKWKEQRNRQVPLYNQRLNPNTENNSFDCYMNKYWVIENENTKKCWVVKCDDLFGLSNGEVVIKGGKYDKCHCPCTKYYQIKSFNELKKDDYKLVDLTK